MAIPRESIDVILVNGKELDDEAIVICPAHLARKATIFQASTGICCVVVFDNVIRCPETFWETHITHVAPKRLGPWPLRVEATPLPAIVCDARIARPHPLVGLMMR
jgi:hypothetical protein